jgi:glycosyltransferase (activator-dependent family)
MRVLFATYPDKTVFQPMVPLAWALRTAGHEVRVAAQPSFAEVITQAGLTAVPVGRDRNTWRLAGMFPEESEAERDGLPPPYDAAIADPDSLDPQAMRDGYAHMVASWHRLDNFPITGGLIEFAERWQPDLVIWEPITYAGGIAAKACGAASARLLWSIDVFGRTRERFLAINGDGADPLADWLGPYARKYSSGFSEEYVTGDFTINPVPPSLRLDADVHHVGMQYVPYGGRAVVPRWVWEQPRRPRIGLTLGVSATEIFAGYAVSAQDLLDALADLDIELIATIAESEQPKLRVPANTRLVSYVPLHALAPTCAAVVNHAGPGTLLTIARYGVPQLTVPYDFDEPALAGLAARHGSSLTMNASEATGAAVREGLVRLLEEDNFRERAAALRDEILEQPAPNQVVPLLEALATKYRTTPVR